MRLAAAAFIGGPWDMHRIVSDMQPTVRVPVVPNSQSIYEAAATSSEVRIEHAEYRLYKLPSPLNPEGIHVYIYQGSK